LRRFGIRVYVDLPAKRDRKRIVGRLLRDVEHTLTTEQLDDLAIATEGWSGSDLEYLTREAAMAPIRACIQAASAVKRRALKLQQRGGDESSQERGSRGVDPNDLAREKLLTDFQALRPISLEDFENAVQFFLGKENEPNQRVGTLTQKRHREHYDSSSDEDS
jgi:SpoVK/Ycf46/Vps4 family AAA+-type ATPase